MKKLKYIAVIFLFLGCKKIEKIEMAGSITPKLIVNCAAREGELFSFTVHKSLSVLDNASIKPVKTGTIKLFGDGVLLESLKYNSLFENYTSNTIAKSGIKYSFEASASGFATVTASTKIPEQVAIKTVDLKITGKTFDSFGTQSIYGNFKAGKLRISFDDKKGVENYYMIQINSRNKNSGGSFINFMTFWETPKLGVETISIDYNSDASSGSQFYFKDDFEDGKEIVIDFNTDQEYNQYRYNDNNLEGYDITLFNMSGDYSKHIYTINISKQNAEDPFEEPVQIFSNVQGGYGVFGAVSSAQIFVAFP